MDNDVVSAKLESLRRCLNRIRAKTPESVEILVGDYDLQDIISINLQRAVHVCVDIANHLIADSDAEPPSTLGQAFDTLASLDVIPSNVAARLKGAVGFRNIAVHAYQTVDWEIVYNLITTRLEDFETFAARVSTLLDQSA